MVEVGWSSVVTASHNGHRAAGSGLIDTSHPFRQDTISEDHLYFSYYLRETQQYCAKKCAMLSLCRFAQNLSEFSQKY